jgi:hypothetical protein
MTILFILLSLILSLTVDAQAQTFPRGQWTLRSGDGKSLNDAVTKGDGIIKDADGNVIPIGTQVGAWAQNSPIRDMWAGWAQGGAWDTTHSQFIAGMSNSGFPTYDLNAFDVATGTWNPTGRPQRSFSEFVKKNAKPYLFPPELTLFGSGGKGPWGFVDFYDHYTDITTPSAIAGGHGIIPQTGHHQGGVIWMPSVQRLAFLGTFGIYPSDQGVSISVSEFDPATHKWTVDLVGNDFQPDPNNNPPTCAAWDSRRNRVLVVSTGLFTSGTGTIWAYDPAQPAGSRVTRLTGFTSNLAMPYWTYPACVYDPKRDQLRVYGAFPERGNQFGALSFSRGGGTATAPAFTGFSQPLGWIPSAGLLYDPVADKDVIWYGGTSGFTLDANPGITGDSRTLFVIDPDTHSSQSLAVGPVSPDIPTGARGGRGLFVWGRFAYLPAYDVYAVLTDVFTPGAFIFAPDRSTGPLASTRGR